MFRGNHDNPSYFNDIELNIYNTKYLYDMAINPRRQAHTVAFTGLIETLKELGCKYLLAAGEIVGAEEKGYRLCKIFDAPEYTYFIYLYEVL